MTESSIDGVDELLAKFKELELLPTTLVTHAAKKGANMALKYALDNLQPINQQGADFLGRFGKKESHMSGTLKSLLRLKMEKTARGKTVYRIDTTWYARFIDLGFTDRKGVKWDGTHFLKYASTKHFEEIKDAMIEDMVQGIDKVANQ